MTAHQPELADWASILDEEARKLTSTDGPRAARLRSRADELRGIDRRRRRRMVREARRWDRKQRGGWPR